MRINITINYITTAIINNIIIIYYISSIILYNVYFLGQCNACTSAVFLTNVKHCKSHRRKG